MDELVKLSVTPFGVEEIDAFIEELGWLDEFDEFDNEDDDGEFDIDEE